MEVITNSESLSIANNDFTLSLYTELAKSNNRNIFYSLFSIRWLMFMASVGAVSNTFDEMIDTIHLDKSTHSLEAYNNLLKELTRDNENLKLANGMFVDSKFTVKSNFVENCKTYLKSSIKKLNFKKNPEKQRQYLNNWVLNKTNNKINNLFSTSSINSNTMLVLANAVYFKSDWAHGFDDVIDAPFYLTPNKELNIKMMTLRRDLQYYHDDSLKFGAIELPYKFYAFKMIILLPDKQNGLRKLEKNISKIKLHEISDKMRPYYVTVKLPGFNLVQSFDLKTVLSNLGSPKMFTPEAKFPNIVDKRKLYVNNFGHKAYIDVNDNGTVATAVSGNEIYYLHWVLSYWFFILLFKKKD